MLRAILLKEWIKIRRAWLVVLGANLCLLGYVAVATRRLFILDHPEVVWYRLLHLGQLHCEALRLAPLCTGLALACFQFLPETRGERLRLALHLPFPPHGIIPAHVLAGGVLAGAIVLVQTAGLALLTAHWFPLQAVILTLLSVLPWTVAGLVGYLGATLALLEPELPRRLCHLALTAGLAGLFLRQVQPGAYALVLPLLALCLPLLAAAVLLPAYRFRYRRTR